jgi:hypothetical protein
MTTVGMLAVDFGELDIVIVAELETLNQLLFLVPPRINYYPGVLYFSRFQKSWRKRARLPCQSQCMEHWRHVDIVVRNSFRRKGTTEQLKEF